LRQALDLLTTRAFRLLSILGILMIVGSVPLRSQDSNPFDSLEVWSQRDYSIVLRKLFVMGDPSEPSGLFALQKIAIEELKLAAELDLDEKSAVENASNQFAYRTVVADRTFEFRRSISPRIASIYLSDWQSLAEGTRSFDRIMTSKVLELKQKEFALSRPGISRFEPLGGLSGFAVQQFFEIRDLLPSADLLNALKSRRLLEFDQFAELLKLLNPSADTNSTLAFQQYANYRLISRIDEWPCRSSESFKEYFIFQAENLRDEALRRGLAAPSTSSNSVEIQFLWLLRQWILTHQPVATFEWKDDEVELLSGWNFLLSQYAHRWPEYDRLPSELEFDAPSRAIIAEETDEMVLALFPAEQSSDFLSAVEQFHQGLWLDLPADEAALRTLPEDLRRVLAARLFPDLSVRNGKALLEGRLFDSLTELDRRELLSAIFGSDIPTEEYQKQLNLSTQDPAALHRYHYELVSRYLFERELIKAPTDSFTLPSGENIPSVEKQRREMRLLLAQNRDNFDYGFYPAALIDELVVLLFPSQEHLSKLEPKRFWNEWERQKILRDFMISQQGFLAQLKTSATEEQRTQVEQQMLETMLEFQAKLASYPIDPNSEATWLAAFLSGALPHSAETKEILKTIGIGATFAISVKIFGIRAVSWFVALDTGARLLTSGYWNEGLEKLNLENGFSTPVGKWTAQSLQDGLALLTRLQTAKTPEESLELAYDLGSLGSDVVWFSLGAAGARWSLDLSSYRRWRRANSIHSEIKNLEKSAKVTQNRIDQLKSNLANKLESWEVMNLSGRAATDQARVLQRSIDDLRIEIFDLEQVRLTKVQGRIGFYSKALISSVIEISKSIVPSQRTLKERLTKLKRYWSRRSNVAIEQYAREVQRLEAELFKIEHQEWAWQNSARGLQKSISEFQRLQNQMNLHFLEAQTVLEAAANLPPAKAQKLFQSARKSLEKAKSAWSQSKASFDSAWERSLDSKIKSQPLNSGLKRVDSQLTGAHNPFGDLSSFPRRMNATLHFQLKTIESLLSKVPQL